MDRRTILGVILGLMVVVQPLASTDASAALPGTTSDTDLFLYDDGPEGYHVAAIAADNLGVPYTFSDDPRALEQAATSRDAATLVVNVQRDSLGNAVDGIYGTLASYANSPGHTLILQSDELVTCTLGWPVGSCTEEEIAQVLRSIGVPGSPDNRFNGVTLETTTTPCPTLLAPTPFLPTGYTATVPDTRFLDAVALERGSQDLASGCMIDAGNEDRVLVDTGASGAYVGVLPVTMRGLDATGDGTDDIVQVYEDLLVHALPASLR